MRNQASSHDLRNAALIGVGAELVLALRSVAANNELAPRHPWREISQMPGAYIAIRLFRFMDGGYIAAMACAAMIQSAIFTALIFTALQVFRCVRSTDRRC